MWAVGAVGVLEERKACGRWYGGNIVVGGECGGWVAGRGRKRGGGR